MFFKTVPTMSSAALASALPSEFWHALVNSLTLFYFAGLNFEIPEARCVQNRQNSRKKSREDTCKLSSSDDKFKFNSTKRLHGDKAELLVSKQFGPKYCGLKFVVYRGEMAFSYQYPMCYPKNNVNETKWCL